MPKVTSPSDLHNEFARSPFLLRRGFLLLAVALLTAAALVLSSCSPAAAPAKVQAAVSQPTAVATVQPFTRPAGSGSEFPLVAPQDGVVRVPVAGLSDGQARFYAIQSGNKTIPFFVVQGSDQVVRAALDACDVCYEAKLGYHQEGNVMVCNACGNRFPLTRINEEKGGCNPSPLNAVVKGDQIIIQLAELEAGSRYF
ncbi:MAG: DUF2318 domain-containing protein [Chloroflexi bacterium]|nr:DUF2318 domain-containing protein [Chloroflexota bacterium]